MLIDWLLMFFNNVERLSPYHHIKKGSTQQANGCGKGNNLLNKIDFDIVSSAWKHAAVGLAMLITTGSNVAITAEDLMVNRVGFSREEYEGTIYDYGFFWEYSRDSMMFDSDSELYSNFVKLSLEAANEIVEFTTYRDILTSATSKVYAGKKSAIADVTDKVTYDMLMDMYDTLYDNRVPDQTPIIKGSRLIDTKVVGNGYFVYVSHKMARQIMELTDKADGTGEKVFVGVEHYAYAANKSGKTQAASGEIGKIGPFRFIKVRNMTEASYFDDTKTLVSKAGVYPLVIVGEGAVKGITLHTNKKGKGRYEILVKKPGYQTADRHDPYGKTGFYSIQWQTGVIAQRAERIVVGFASVV